jgi:hypothetical protein
MTIYEYIIAAIACVNLMLTVYALLSRRGNDTAEKLDDLEREFTQRQAEHSTAIARLNLLADRALTNDDIRDLYRDVHLLSEKVHTMIGQQAQMNENLRLLLNKLDASSMGH